MILKTILIIINQVDFFVRDRTREPFPKRLESTVTLDSRWKTGSPFSCSSLFLQKLLLPKGDKGAL